MYLTPRAATVDDVDVLLRHRLEMFAAMGTPRDTRFEAMTAACAPWFRRHLIAGTYLGFLIPLAAEPRSIVAGGGVLLLDWPPTYRDPGTIRGYVLNVYVEAAHRRKGLARAVTRACLDACRERAIGVVTLHASDEGRPLYESLGFEGTNEMRLTM